MLIRLTLLSLVLGQPARGSDLPEGPWTSGRLEPIWSGIEPLRVVKLEADDSGSETTNGAALARAILALRPGDRLEIGPGRYSIEARLDLTLRGTPEAPIWIVGADPAHPPVITRPDARQNVLNIGERSRAEYVALRHLELTGGSTLIRIHDGHHLWLDHCELHHAGHEGLTTNTRDTSHLFITHNHFHHFEKPDATGEAMYLGANHGKVIMSHSVIYRNHVHDCGGSQGDGIELKQGSHHNWIVLNHVHDTRYPAILVYGTGGRGINLVERNLCYRSKDNVIQAQGEAVIRNNVLISGGGSGFASTDHQGKSTRLTVVHNTIISGRRGANLSSWNDREGMIFANNAVYTDGGDAIRFPRGANGVTVAGNVVHGRVTGVTGGFVTGTGLGDFESVSWDAERRNTTPAPDGPLVGAADPRFLVEVDHSGRPRGDRPTAGALEVR